MTKLFIIIIALLSIAGCGSKIGKEVTTASGLKYTDIKEGTGASAVNGKTVTVHYVGTLTDGKKIDSSIDKGQPFQFVVGSNEIVPGWNEGVVGMKVGGKRKLVIPPNLGWGSDGAGDLVPPNAVTIFEVELLDVK